MVGSEGGVGPCQDIGRNWDGCGCDQEDDCSIMGAVWRALALARSKTLHPPFQFSLGLSMGNCCHHMPFDRGKILPQFLSATSQNIDSYRLKRREIIPVTAPVLPLIHRRETFMEELHPADPRAS